MITCSKEWHTTFGIWSGGETCVVSICLSYTHLPSRKNSWAGQTSDQWSALALKEEREGKRGDSVGLLSSPPPHPLLICSSSTFHGDPEISVGWQWIFPKERNFWAWKHSALILLVGFHSLGPSTVSSNTPCSLSPLPTAKMLPHYCAC